MIGHIDGRLEVAARGGRRIVEAVLAKQEETIKKQLGCARVAFKVVVQDGKVKLKASAG